MTVIAYHNIQFPWELIVRRLYIVTFVFAFDNYSTPTYNAYATCAFKGHSLLSASRVVITITSLLSYPIIARLSDVSAYWPSSRDTMCITDINTAGIRAC